MLNEEVRLFFSSHQYSYEPLYQHYHVFKKDLGAITLKIIAGKLDEDGIPKLFRITANQEFLGGFSYRDIKRSLSDKERTISKV